MSKLLVVASRNEKKVDELKRLLAPLPLVIYSLAEFGDSESVEETGSTFMENARLKALAISRFTGEMAIADDSGLMVKALNGLPGVKSARFSGNNASDEENNTLLLSLLKGIPREQRQAMFVCAIAISTPAKILWETQAQCYGSIALKPSAGQYGFGYDPLFIPEGMNKTFAELKPEEKDEISHRGKALKATYQFLKDQVKN